MTFIKPDQTNWTVETKGLSFGTGSTPVSTTLNLDQSLIGASGYNITASVATGAPFTIIVANANTATPIITLYMSGIPVLGRVYVITITSGSLTSPLNVVFLFSEDYQTSNWINANTEDNVGGFFKLSQIAQGAQLLSASLNTKLRSLLQYANLANIKINNHIQAYRIKKNLPDIINAAIFAGNVPAGYTGTVTYGTGTPVPANAIASILLHDTLVDFDSYTQINFNYSTQQKTITPVGKTPVIANYQALSNIVINRVNAYSNVQYNIATVTVQRTSSTFTSVIDSTYSVTMPLITGWTVIG